MGLQHIKHLRITKYNEFVEITGQCKLTKEFVEIKIPNIEYQAWKGGCLLDYCLLSVSFKHRFFLKNGYLP